jgi:hypothetical protein
MNMYELLIKILVYAIGFFLIDKAVNMHRFGDSKVKHWSKYFWIQWILILIAALLFSYKQFIK